MDIKLFMKIGIILLAIIPFSHTGYATNVEITKDSAIVIQIQKCVSSYINSSNFNNLTGYNKTYNTSIDSVKIDREKKLIHIYYDNQFCYTPFRIETIDSINAIFKSCLSNDFKKFSPVHISNGKELQDLIPNYFQTKKKNLDKSRAIQSKQNNSPIIVNNSKSWLQKSQLSNNHIALWHSHGWYYEPTLHRWEWQRARLFRTVEDLYPMVYTMNYIVPMLENAGAKVFIPRERDWQLNEVIVDNNQSHGNSKFIANTNTTEIKEGFAIGKPPYVIENPFKLGTALKYTTTKQKEVIFEYIPEIPETGLYPVYISYKTLDNSSDKIIYRVYHTGGETEFLVNQTMGGSTWIYLGKFKFLKGINPGIGKVEVISTEKDEHQIITSDAVRFGSGYGNISRNGLISERPRYQEGARYYLQYAGIPDTLVWYLNTDKADDYGDDYQSRGEWVDYLIGAPSGPRKNRDEKGLRIPIDLSFAFHTDAGITDNDTVIGTLGIYSTKKDSSVFPSGISKMASRDLTDVIQTQIVDDIRKKYDVAWTRRGMWDKGYSEAFRPMVPAMLLELFSHQNFLDSRFGHEPQFQFDVSRSIYKGMAKFLASMYQSKYIIQPLPITHFKTKITENSNIKLSWNLQVDPLEATANPTAYIVYTKIGNNGYNNGIMVKKPEYILENPIKDSIYSFKIAAYNKGGESMCSEELSTCISSKNNEKILIVNAFDRLGTPAWFNDQNYGGFLDQVDEGVPFMYDFYTVGNQYDFYKKSPWLDDDSPGFGASSADLENQIIAGNTFNYSYTHGKSILSAGYSFESISDEAFEMKDFNTKTYSIIDIVAGEEKTSYFPKNDSIKHYQLFTNDLINKLDSYLNSGGNLFISGAHLASDFHSNKQDSIIGNLLKIKWRTSNASKNGNFYFMNHSIAPTTTKFSFNTEHNPNIYRVEGADAIEPNDTTAQTLLRYSENNMSAGVAYKNNYGVVAIGFPFETILNENERNLIMQKIILFLKNDK